MNSLIESSAVPSYSFDKETGWRIGLPSRIEPGKRVLCLYRVSTAKQLYRDANDEADIPMQRLRCREFAEQRGWTIVCELQEEGVSGHKVRAENRDKVQMIKEYATRGKFDILLVFMFDRIESTFAGVLAMLEARSRKYRYTRTVPLNTRGKALVAGMVFCGHCGARLSVTTSGKGRKNAQGVDTIRMRYCCQSKTRKNVDYGGQTGYTVTKLDGIIEDVIHEIFSKVRAIDRDEILRAQSNIDLNLYRQRVKSLEQELAKAGNDLAKLQSEIVKSLTGESVFSPEMLKSAIDTQEAKRKELQKSLELAHVDLDAFEISEKAMAERLDEMLSWASIYDEAPMPQKKMIVSSLIQRIDVYKGYEIKMTLNISVRQFLETIETQE